MIAGLALGAVLEYQRAGREAERRFNEKQVLQAHHAADQLSEVFRKVRTLLSLLATMEVHRAAGPSQLLALMVVVQDLRGHGAIVGCTTSNGQPLLATQPVDARLRQLVAALPQCPGADGLCLSGPLRSTLSPSGWVIAASMGVAQTRPLTTAATAAPERGVVLVLDWGALQRWIVHVSRYSPESYAWVLDQRGRLILHPEHRTEPGQSALAVEASCSQCHTAFEIHRRMTAGEIGAGRVQVGREEPKLVAFAPIAAGAGRWSLGIATPASLVTSRGLGASLLFFGAIILVMVVGALLLDRESSRRVRIADAFSRELERMVAERTEELKALYARLASLQTDHTRLERVAVAGELAAIVAHEIRTPLNALSINAQLIIRMLRREQPEARQKALELLATLEGEVQRINTMLEDHLLALVRHRPTNVQSLCLNEQVLDSVRFMEPEAKRQGVLLVHELAQGLPRVQADAAKLRQILLNIILNGIQAMPGGGQVRLSTRCNGHTAQVAIEDTGPGIPGADGDDVDQVFRPFVTTKEDGTGLGLAICGRLIKEMKGSIRVRSELGHGARFEISLPLTEPEAAA